VLADLDSPNVVPTRLDNLTENLIWATDGSEIDTVVARGRVLKEGGRVFAFQDGSTPDRIVAAVRKLADRFAAYRMSAPELKGTGVHR
jgi:hypothetical protein